MTSPDFADLGAGFSIRAGKAVSGMPVPETLNAEGGGDGLRRGADKAEVNPPVPAGLCDQLAELGYRRKFFIAVTNKQTNAAKALVRRALGYNASDEEDSRAKSSARAARIVANALAGKEQKPDDAELAAALAFDLHVIGEGVKPFIEARHGIELEMKRAVRKLPVYAWAKDVKGLGELGLAVIVAEAGDLSKYPKKGHLWKRLGLAPFEGKAYSTWRREGGLTAEEWTTAGYSPRRRAEIYAVISEPLFRAQSVANFRPYRWIYDARREQTAIAHPDWKPIHSHMDGLRKMTKILLRDLWQAWNGRKAVVSVPPTAAGVGLPTDLPLAAE